MTSRDSVGGPVIDRHGEARACIDHGFIPGQALVDGRVIIRAWDQRGSPIAPAAFLARCRRVLRERAKEFPGSRLAERFRRSREIAREASLRVRSLPVAASRPGPRLARARAHVGTAARRNRTRPAALARDGDGDPPGPRPRTAALAAPVASLSGRGAP